MKSSSRVRLFATPWTVAYQAPPSMGFPRQEYWSGLPFPSPGDLSNPGIKPGSPALQIDALQSEPHPSMTTGKTIALIILDSDSKESTCQCMRCRKCGFDPWLGKIPWRRKWEPTPVFLPEKSHGQRSLVGCGPRGRKESAMTSTHGETKIQHVKINKQIPVPL